MAEAADYCEQTHAAPEALLRLLIHTALSPADSAAVRDSDALQRILTVVRAAPQPQPGATAFLNVFDAIAAAGQQRVNPAAALRWPSDRHANDVADFRRIEVVPTPAETGAGVETYLPLADGSDQFLSWRVRI